MNDFFLGFGETLTLASIGVFLILGAPALFFTVYGTFGLFLYGAIITLAIIGGIYKWYSNTRW